MSENDYKERRRFPRIQADHLVLVKKVDDEPEKAVARTVDVGLGGCRFVNDYRMGKNAVINLAIIFENSFIEIVGKILYELPRDDGKYDVGVEFAVIGKEDKERLLRLTES